MSLASAPAASFPPKQARHAPRRLWIFKWPKSEGNATLFCPAAPALPAPARTILRWAPLLPSPPRARCKAPAPLCALLKWPPALCTPATVLRRRRSRPLLRSPPQSSRLGVLVCGHRQWSRAASPRPRQPTSARGAAAAGNQVVVAAPPPRGSTAGPFLASFQAITTWISAPTLH